MRFFPIFLAMSFGMLLGNVYAMEHLSQTCEKVAPNDALKVTLRQISDKLNTNLSTQGIFSTLGNTLEQFKEQETKVYFLNRTYHVIEVDFWPLTHRQTLGYVITDINFEPQALFVFKKRLVHSCHDEPLESWEMECAKTIPDSKVHLRDFLKNVLTVNRAKYQHEDRLLTSYHTEINSPDDVSSYLSSLSLGLIPTCSETESHIRFVNADTQEKLKRFSNTCVIKAYGEYLQHKSSLRFSADLTLCREQCREECTKPASIR